MTDVARIDHFPRFDRGQVAVTQTRLSGWDVLLVCVFLVGLYTNYTIMVTAKVPFPSLPSGVAGLILLWRRRDLITERALRWFLIVELLFLISMLCAPNVAFLPRRSNGLIQLTYSLTIGYALFLTITLASRRQVAAILLGFALIILVGCLAETYAGLRSVSNAVRKVLYSSGVYENDLRDVLFYKRIRPKFFASEPASVTFCYTLFSFLWLVVSRWRWKLLGYAGLVAVGLFAMPGPTLLLMLLLLLPYLMFLRKSAGRQAGIPPLLDGRLRRGRVAWRVVVLPKCCLPSGSKRPRPATIKLLLRLQGPPWLASTSCHAIPLLVPA